MKMKFIEGGKALADKLAKLADEHQHISFAVAWASLSDKTQAIFNKNKIEKAVIGTHFYQTDPEVLKAFIECDKCRFVFESSGVFHPKVYLFWTESSKKWDLLIGSANLTNAALKNNTELLLHVSYEYGADSFHKNAEKIISEYENRADSFRKNAEKMISQYYGKGETVTRKKADWYESMYKSKRQILARVSGEYKGKDLADTEMMPMSWDDFLKEVKTDKHFEARLKLLDFAKKEFANAESFFAIDDEARKIIAGIDERGELFGNMEGAGRYVKAINANNKVISKALDCIPEKGDVIYEHYASYIEMLKKTLPEGGKGWGISAKTRLLALKRPDQFVCVNGENDLELCQGFGIKPLRNNDNRYWNDLICRIRDSAWWNSDIPQGLEQRRVWHGRVAMLDAIFYNRQKKS